MTSSQISVSFTCGYQYERKLTPSPAVILPLCLSLVYTCSRLSCAGASLSCCCPLDCLFGLDPFFNVFRPPPSPSSSSSAPVLSESCYVSPRTQIYIMCTHISHIHILPESCCVSPLSHTYIYIHVYIYISRAPCIVPYQVPALFHMYITHETHNA
jgi:hypothetical protein